MAICFHFVCFFVLNSRRNRLNGYWRILVVLLQAGEPNHLYIGQGHRSEAIIIIRSTVNTIGNLCFATVAGEMILQWVPLYFIRLWDDDMYLLFVETLLTFSSCCVSGTASPLPWFTSGQGHVSTSMEDWAVLCYLLIHKLQTRLLSERIIWNWVSAPLVTKILKL